MVRDQKTLKIAYLLAFANFIAFLVLAFIHSQDMWRYQREIFALQEDVLSLQERVVKLQKATFGVVERSSIDKLPHRSDFSAAHGSALDTIPASLAGVR